MALFSHWYVDFTSLYPWGNAMTRTVVGHPRIITENFVRDISNYFGLIKCTVIPQAVFSIPFFLTVRRTS